jgi:light-regulated signal transduction histidine kinase (bacteriophytochrome)
MVISRSGPNHAFATEALRLADLCRQMEECTSKLAHDLRVSVQLITCYANLLSEEANGLLDPEQLKCLLVIKAGAMKVQDAIERGQARLDELVRSESKLK